MTLGRAQLEQGFQDPRQILGERLREGSIYRLLADHGQVIAECADDCVCQLHANRS
jgi:hypothetical protein